jgi:hypothetical protein
VIASLLSSPEYFYRVGAGSNIGFLTALYRDVLGRPIDPSGAAAWTYLLEHGWNRSTVVNMLLGSMEAKQVLVQGFYQRFLHRAADSGGLNAFANALRQGMRDDQVIAILVGSGEYAANV